MNFTEELLLDQENALEVSIELDNSVEFGLPIMRRTKDPKNLRIRRAVMDPASIQRELNNRSLFEFIKFFWPEISQNEFKPNWHIEFLCKELEEIAYMVANNIPKTHDLIINIPPGTTKTITVSIMFPVWCWTKWTHLRFITGSYSGALSLESAEYSRDLIRSKRFQWLYPDVDIKEDKDTKSNYMVVKKTWKNGLNKVPSIQQGGNRYSTSVGGTLTGFHGHILIWDDPENPKQAISDVERNIANHWIDQTASTRKVDKAISTTIVVMQRLHQDDVTGHILSKKKKNVRHICLPGEILRFKENLNPPELEEKYVDGLLDPLRMPLNVLHDMEEDMGQYGYAGQVGQNPTPPEGGMFKVDNFEILDNAPEKHQISYIVRYWDKAGTKEKYDGKPGGAYTVGCKMARLRNGKFCILDIKRGRWEATERELIIKRTAQADGASVYIYMEQEPGSGGKESAQSTIRNLAGYAAYADLPHGDKIFRADPYSVQVNNMNVSLLRGLWNADFIDEHRFFPNSKYKDQVDAAAGAFGKLSGKRMVHSLTK